MNMESWWYTYMYIYLFPLMFLLLQFKGSYKSAGWKFCEVLLHIIISIIPIDTNIAFVWFCFFFFCCNLMLHFYPFHCRLLWFMSSLLMVLWLSWLTHALHWKIQLCLANWPITQKAHICVVPMFDYEAYRNIL